MRVTQVNKGRAFTLKEAAAIIERTTHLQSVEFRMDGQMHGQHSVVGRATYKTKEGELGAEISLMEILSILGRHEKRPVKLRRIPQPQKEEDPLLSVEFYTDDQISHSECSIPYREA